MDLINCFVVSYGDSCNSHLVELFKFTVHNICLFQSAAVPCAWLQTRNTTIQLYFSCLYLPKVACYYCGLDPVIFTIIQLQNEPVNFSLCADHRLNNIRNKLYINSSMQNRHHCKGKRIVHYFVQYPLYSMTVISA